MGILHKSSMDSKKDMIALVTGGAGGIGSETAMTLAREGARVIIADLYEKVEETAEILSRKSGGKITGLRVDVSDFDSCTKLRGEVEKVVGERRMDIIVNNAGITRDALLTKMDFATWDKVIRVDLYSAFNVTKNFVEWMIERKFGRIVSLSSISWKGNVGQVNYSSAKAGIVGFTGSLSRELARYGITVNAIAPGLIDTDILKSIPDKIMQGIIEKIPMRRLGKPEEVASLISFLTSRDTSYITGEVVSINGGFNF